MRRLRLVTIVVAAIILASTTSATELRLGTAAPKATPWGQALDEFAGRVAELSEGELTVSIYYNSELGDEQTMARQLPRGRLNMALLSNVASSLLVPEYGLLLLPYAFDDLEVADCVIDNYFAGAFNENFQAAGVVLLASVEVGQMVIMSKKLFRTPADVVGEKIRTSPTPTDTLYIQSAGAAAVPLGTVDSMPALKTGAVVAVTTPIVMGVAAGYAAEAPQITLTRHGHQLGTLLISKKTWDRLGDKEHDALTEASATMTELRQAIRDSEKGLLEQAEKAGAVVYAPNAEEGAAWKGVAASVDDQIISGLGGQAASVWAEITSAKSACSR